MRVMRRPIIAIDFDGTLSEYSEWKGVGKYGNPIKDAVDSCWVLSNAGCDLVVWTCRHMEDDMIELWLAYHGFPEFFGVNKDVSEFHLADQSGPKIYADVYIDDRAAGWTNWSDALSFTLKALREADLIPEEARSSISVRRFADEQDQDL